jgi:predicted nucleic acid-binding protein
MIAVDSCFCIDFLKGDLGAKAAYEMHRKEGLCTTDITVFEVMVGAFSVAARTKNVKDIDLCTSMLAELRILPSLGAYAMDAAAYHVARQKKGKASQAPDLLIAGIMVANGVERILTRNAKDFTGIPGIKAVVY